MTPAPIHCGWALALLALSACTETPLPGEDLRANPRDPTRIALGSKVYSEHCAGCHGAKLEGQPNWRSRLPNGRMPAPPHDDTGHTWHHPDHVLFGITKAGLVPPYAPKDYQSDMPAFGGKLADDEIWTVLAYIKSRWTKEVLPARAEILRNDKALLGKFSQDKKVEFEFVQQGSDYVITSAN